MNAIVPFTFGDQPVRVSDRDGEPWFVLADVCRVLDLKNVSDAAARLDPDERDDIGLTDAIGREQATVVINEPGLYRLIFRSRKESAQRFSKWVRSDVLPTIRRTGSYGAPAPALDLTDTATLHRLLLDHTGRTLAADERIAEMQPKAEAMERLAKTEGSMAITDAAKALGVSPRKLFAWMEAHSWIYRRTDDGPWIGYQAKLDAKVIESKVHRQPQRFGPDKLRERVLVTPKGLARLAEVRAGH